MIVYIRKVESSVQIAAKTVESALLYDWRFTANQFVLATSPLRLTTSNCFFQLNTCDYSPYVTSSLTRGWVCRLQLLLGHASAVILRFEPRGTHDHILLSQIRDCPNLEGQVPVFISLRNRVARLHPQALGSLSVVSYDSQGSGGGIRPRLHTGYNGISRWLSLYNRDTDSIANTALTSNYPTFPLLWRRVSIAADTCLPRLGNMFSLTFPSNGRLISRHYSGVSPHVTIFYLS
jgi:hypothetical protein